MSDRDGEFARLIGSAALKAWPDLPRHVQEELFERAVPDGHADRHRFAVYLHDHHPRTAHPPRPA